MPQNDTSSCSSTRRPLLRVRPTWTLPPLLFPRSKIVILIARRFVMGFWCGEGGGERHRDYTVASARDGVVYCTTVGVKGVCLLSVNDDNRVIVKRFSGTRSNPRVYASRALLLHNTYHLHCKYLHLTPACSLSQYSYDYTDKSELFTTYIPFETNRRYRIEWYIIDSRFKFYTITCSYLAEIRQWIHCRYSCNSMKYLLGT